MIRSAVFALLALVMPPAERAAPAPPPAPLPSSVDGLPIGAIPPQALPPGSCAAFLWTATTNRTLIAMVSAAPAQVRFAPYGKLTDLVRVTQSGGGALGLSNSSDYAGGDIRVSIVMDIAVREDLTNGAAVPSGTLRFDREGQDSVVVPVVGLIGCG